MMNEETDKGSRRLVNFGESVIFMWTLLITGFFHKI